MKHNLPLFVQNTYLWLHGIRRIEFIFDDDVESLWLRDSRKRIAESEQRIAESEQRIAESGQRIAESEQPIAYLFDNLTFFSDNKLKPLMPKSDTRLLVKRSTSS